MQDFNTPKTGEGTSPAAKLSDVIVQYHSSMAAFEAIAHDDDDVMKADAERMYLPVLRQLEKWDAPAADMNDVTSALALVQSELDAFEAPAACLPLVSSALDFLRQAQEPRHLDASDVYWQVREALGVVRLAQVGLDAFLEDHSIGSDKSARLRDMEQAGVVAARILDRALGALEKLEKLKVIGGAA
jgi:hypothetical protein